MSFTDRLTPSRTTTRVTAPALSASDRLVLLDPPPRNGHWLAEVEGRDPAYETADHLHDLCWALGREAAMLADSERDSAEAYAQMGDYQEAWEAGKKADRLDNLAANLDFDRRIHAPLFTGPNAGAALKDSMLHAMGEAIDCGLIRYVQVCTCDGSQCGHGWEEQ